MTSKRLFMLFSTALIFCGVTSCTPYKITLPLEKPINPPATCTLGEISDGLPMKMEESARPTLEEVNKLRAHLYNELNSVELFEMLADGDTSARYEVGGTIEHFKRGSGIARFLIGFGLGNAQLIVKLEMYDRLEKQYIFGGDFKAEVADWLTKGDEVFKRAGRDFARTFAKQQKKLIKAEEQKNKGDDN